MLTEPEAQMLRHIAKRPERFVDMRFVPGWSPDIDETLVDMRYISPSFGAVYVHGSERRIITSRGLAALAAHDEGGSAK